MTGERKNLVTVDRLTVDVAGRGRGERTPILTDVSLSIGEGEAVGLVGESGSGKSMTTKAIMRLLPKGARTTGSVTFRGVEISGLDRAVLVDPPIARSGDDLPGPARSYQPALDARRLHHGRRRRLGSADKAPGARPRHRATGGRRNRRWGTSPAPVPASALRRTAAAGDDRGGTHARPDADHRGRADHGPGCHRAVRSHGDPRRTAHGERCRAALHHPRPRPGRRRHRQHRRHVCGADHREGTYGERDRCPTTSVHRGRFSNPVHRPSESSGSRPSPGVRSLRGRGDGGLRVRQPMPVRCRNLPHRAAGD